MTTVHQDTLTTPSTGLVATTAGWLDTHFEACRPEYEAQVRAAGFQPGWRVLDAGCGSGGFIPWLADIAGPTGAITAIDLAPENVAVVEQRLATQHLACPVEVRLAELTALPYPTNAFDGVWCANVAQYLGDDELLGALAEFRRVVRPGGLVAVKDTAGVELHPLRPYLRQHLNEAGGRQFTNVFFRSPMLRRWLERAGLEGVWQRRTPIERWAPFSEAQRQLLIELLAVLARLAGQYGVAPEEVAEWERVSDPTSPDHPANAPNGYSYESNILAVGRVPAG